MSNRSQECDIRREVLELTHYAGQCISAAMHLMPNYNKQRHQ